MLNHLMAAELQKKFHDAAIRAGAEWATAEMHAAKKEGDLDTMVVHLIVNGEKQKYETKVYPNPNTSTDEMDYIIKQWVAKALEAEEKAEAKAAEKAKPAAEKKTADERAKDAEDKEIKDKK